MENNTNEYKFDQFYSDIKVLKNAVASLQRKVAFQEEIINKLLDFVNEKNNRFVTYTNDSDEGEYSEAGVSREFVDIYQKEMENKTYRTLKEYCEEEGAQRDMSELTSHDKQILTEFSTTSQNIQIYI